jgi:hypothetical protein
LIAIEGKVLSRASVHEEEGRTTLGGLSGSKEGKNSQEKKGKPKVVEEGS